MRLALAMAVLAWPAAGFAQATPRQEWVVPKALTGTRPSTTYANGIPVTQMAVRSEASVEELARSFVESCQRAGLYVPDKAWHEENRLSRDIHLTAYDPSTRRAYTIWLQPNGDKTVTVIQTEARLGERVTPGDRDGVPTFPGAEKVLVTRDEAALTFHFRVRGVTVASVFDFYDQALAADGFRAEREGPTGSRYQKKSESIDVYASAENDGSVRLTVTKR